MTRPLVSSLVLVLFFTVSVNAQQQPPATSAVVPRLIRFAGSLRDGSGKPLHGPAGVTFALYKEQEGGAALWLETQNVPLDANGRYNVLLGATKEEGVPMELFTSGEAQWLGVRAEGQAEQPRILLVSVPYALKAADADTVGGLPASAFALAAPVASAAPAGSSATVAAPSVVPTAGTTVTTAGGVVNKLAVFDAAADIKSSQIFDNGTNVAIGNTAPAAKLDVSGGGIFRGVLQLFAKGTASATNNAGFASQPLELLASSWNSGTPAAVAQHFRWQAEPMNSNTKSPSGTLNLLYASGAGVPAETGLKINSKGVLTFAAGQKFPATVTSVGLNAPSEFTVTGSPVTGSGTLTLGWSIAPTSANTPNAIVERDLQGRVAVGALNASSVQAQTILGFTSTASSFAIEGVGGVGVEGQSNTGEAAFFASGFTRQDRGSGGWVKAMVYVSGLSSGRIVSCFNSFVTGSTVFTAPCGFSLTKITTGEYILDFGFEVDDRFFSLAPVFTGRSTYNLCTSSNGVTCLSGIGLSPNQVELNLFNLGAGTNDDKFYLVVY